MRGGWRDMDSDSAPKDQIDDEPKAAEEEQFPSIGPLLKAVREDKGLTLDQMVSVTMLRRPLLEAIENENWEDLPAPVFVKGFIRSYAVALGLDENEIVAQYERLDVLKPSLPKPLSMPRRSHNSFIITIVVSLLAVVGLIFLWHSADNRESIPVASEQTMEKPGGGELAGTPPPEKTPPPETETPAETSSVGDTGMEEKERAASEITVETTGETDQEEEPASTQTPATAREPNPEATAVPAGSETDRLLLKAHVLERTWLRITIDDKDPKEYILQPSSMPQWEAVNGFDLLIGNATGIEFEFGDKLYKNLGRRGQVVRVRFPETFRTNIPEE